MSETATDAVSDLPANRPTVEDVLKWPATVDLETAGTAFGISRSFAYELAKRGDFPAAVLPVGGKKRVLTADIVRVLRITPSILAPDPVPDQGDERQPHPARLRPVTR